MTDQARGLDRRAQLLPSITRPNRAPQAQAPGREVHTDSGDDAAPSRVGCPLPRLPQSADVARCRCDRSAAVRPAAIMAPPLRRSRSAGRCPKPALLTAQCTGLVQSEEMHSAHGMQAFSGRLRYRSRRAWRFARRCRTPHSPSAFSRVASMRQTAVPTSNALSIARLNGRARRGPRLSGSLRHPRESSRP